MTKDDFIILRNSITMMQLVNFYGFKTTRKGKTNFMRCPLHAGGSERTPSMIIYEGFRGFYCRGCGTGGDVTKFVELYEGVETKEAALLLSNRFNVPISETGEVPQEVVNRANKARLERERELLRQNETQAKLRQICAYLVAYNQLIKESEPFSSLWCYCQNEIPKLIGEWEHYFGELRKV